VLVRYVTQKLNAMPVLLDLGLPATVFTVTDRLGQSPAWWSGAARVMTRAEVSEMAANGFRIESHTRTHASLVEVRGAALDDEVAGAKAEVEDLTGTASEIIAYPYGHYDEPVVDAVTEAGYVAGYSFLNGRITSGLDRYRLPRLNMTPDQTRGRLAYHLARPPSSWPETQWPAVGPRPGSTR
jgi:peptidoglycan/xylan/chitin deacetylase (PgdA/CDA1 family)